MEFGEAVLFAKFLREQGITRKSPTKVNTKIVTRIQKEEPGLWFKWLAYKAATLQERRK
jgi:hypothetical protein